MLIQPIERSHIREKAVIHVEGWKEAYKNIIPESYLNSLSVEEAEFFSEINLKRIIKSMHL